MAEVREQIERLDRAGCVSTKQFLVGELPWVWLTKRGARLAGTGCSARRSPPATSRLDRLRAINEVRLRLSQRAPHGRWTSENRLRLGDARKVCPNALFEIDGERQAIRVALSYVPKSKAENAIAESRTDYDTVVYFCGPRSVALLRSMEEEGDWPKLVVRDLPNCAPAPVLPRTRWIPVREPTASEIDSLRLISEQGAIPVDQLTRFLDRDGEAVEGLLRGLLDAGYVSSHSFIAGEPEWIWLTERGGRLSGTELRPLLPRSRGLAKLRALNEARLLIEDRFPTAEWIGMRVLLREHGSYARVPGAVVELGGMRHSIDVLLYGGQSEYWLPLISERCDCFDAVVILCPTPKIRAFMEALQDEHRWQKVLVRDLPGMGRRLPGGHFCS